MSFDAYDDLELAEGLIGDLSETLRKLDDFRSGNPWTGLGDAPAELLVDLLASLEQAENYCRITCNHDDEVDCGCPCHVEEDG